MYSLIYRETLHCCRNGHMLTHRNKKPYECMLEGCNKSYCDARSLRRHEENHHNMRGLPVIGDKSKEKEKEARRRNSKTILSLLATNGNSNSETKSENNQTQTISEHGVVTSSVPPTNSTARSTDADSSGSGITSCIPDTIPTKISPRMSTGTSPKTCTSTQLSSSTMPKTSTVSTLIPSTPKAVPIPIVTFSSPQSITSVTTGGVTRLSVQQANSPPIRIPQITTPSPITIPSVRPQFLTARPLATTAAHVQQQHSQQSSQMSVPQDNAGQQAPLAISPPDQESLTVNFVSAYLSPTKQADVQLGVSQTSTSVAMSYPALLTQAQAAQPTTEQTTAIDPQVQYFTYVTHIFVFTWNVVWLVILI